VIVEREAREELAAAAAWYDEQRPGLGDELLLAVEEALERIASAPESFPRDRFDDRARRAAVAQFPYGIVFLVHEGELRIIAFAHGKRLPGHWRGRI
jgi:toxin ParE1/3/4